MTKIYFQASIICGIINSAVGESADSARCFLGGYYSDLYVLTNIIALCAYLSSSFYIKG